MIVSVVVRKDSGVFDDDVENFCIFLEIVFLCGLCEKLEGIIEVDE